MKKLKYLFWIPVPFLLYWALKNIRFRVLFAILGRLTILQIGMLLIVNVFFVLILTLRWAVVLRGLGAPVGLFRLFAYRLAGYAVSYLTPGPQFGGEPLQIYLAKKRSDLGYDVGSASILLDKTFELLGNFAFLGLASLAFLSLDPLTFRGGLRLALLLPSFLVVLPAAYLAAVFFGIRPLSWFLNRLPAGFLARPRIRKTAALIRSSETRILAYCRRRGRTLLQILLFFLLVCTISLAEMRLVLYFLRIPITLIQTLLVLAGGKLAFLLPFPGALGALELTQEGVFELLDLGPQTGMSLVLYIRARDLLFAFAGLTAVFAGGRRKIRSVRRLASLDSG
jgi:uncharacterized protein (TIRG00374 family)